MTDLEPHDEAPTRSMTGIYAAVIVVEAAILLALWWFQTAFGPRS